MKYSGKKAAYATLGCKLNFSETSSVASSMEEMGFTTVGFDEVADVYVVNSCSVTRAGEKSSRNMIRKAIRKNPSGFVVVTGCYAQIKPDEVSRIEGVDMILGSGEKFLLPTLLGDLSKREKPWIQTTPLAELMDFRNAFSAGGRTRSFLKIQDGCDYFCTYCVVPYARGRSRNGPVAGMAEAARSIVAKGFREIVLTGENIGDFGKSTGETFTDLLKTLEKVEGLERLRMGSVEPNLLTDEIIELTARSKVIMPHFHLPLQSGADQMLRLMNRRYNTALFASRVSRIRELLPGAFIGVDVIAGANGESGELFLESYRFIESLPVSQLHAFPYSERTGTKAMEISLKVPAELRKERTLKYISLSERKLRAFYESNRGSTETVLFEEPAAGNRMTGFTRNYIRTVCACGAEMTGRVATVKLLSVLLDGTMQGELQN